MDVQTWQTLIAVFIGITAISFLLQSIAILGLYSRVKHLTERVDDLSGDIQRKIGRLSENVQQQMEGLKPVFHSMQRIGEDLASASAVIRVRAAETDRFLQETTQTVRLQVARVNAVLEHSSSRIQNAVDVWHRGVIAPATEIAALMKGIRTGFNFFMSQRERRHLSRTQPDEELFI